VLLPLSLNVASFYRDKFTVSYDRSFVFIPSKKEHHTAPNPCGPPFQVATLDTKAPRLKAGLSPSPPFKVLLCQRTSDKGHTSSRIICGERLSECRHFTFNPISGS
jgi:hypothetical protein